MFNFSIYSLHEPGKTYVWISPESETKCGENNKVSMNKLDSILKGKNKKVHKIDCMVNNVKYLSLFDSAFSQMLHPIRDRTKGKKSQTESCLMFFMFKFF